MKTIILFLSLLTYPASVLLADPSYCLDLHGVKVTIKDGSRLTGRIVWCSRYFEDFNNIYTGKISPSVGDYIKNNGWNIESYRADESHFTKWIDLVNFVLKQKVSYPERLTYSPLTLYKRIDQISFPKKRSVAIKEETQEIPYNQIAELEIDSTIQTITPEIHLQALTIKDLEILKKEPKYYLSIDPSEYGRMYYLVYSDSASAQLSNLLGHFLITFPEPSITFNGLKIPVRYYDFGGKNIECTDILGKYKQACVKVNTSWDKYQTEMDEKAKPCYNEYRALLKELRKTTDYASSLQMPPVKDKSSECKQISRDIRAKFGFQEFSIDELRDKGVIVVNEHYPD